MSGHVYILRCSKGTYYIGSTGDLLRRMKEHQSGKGGSYTSKNLPVELVYSKEYATKWKAKEREMQIKGWSRVKKEKLIKGEWK